MNPYSVPPICLPCIVPALKREPFFFFFFLPTSCSFSFDKFQFFSFSLFQFFTFIFLVHTVPSTPPPPPPPPVAQYPFCSALLQAVASLPSHQRRPHLLPPRPSRLGGQPGPRHTHRRRHGAEQPGDQPLLPHPAPQGRILHGASDLINYGRLRPIIIIIIIRPGDLSSSPGLTV